MSLLTVIQNMCGRTNVPVPATVLGSVTDPQVLQMLRILEEIGSDLLKRGTWQATTFETTFVTTATEDQGAMTTLAPNGFAYIRNQTFWDRTSLLPIWGPLSDAQWSAIKGTNNFGPHYQYRIRGGHLLVSPVPAAGLTWAFEYASLNWILGADGTTYKEFFTLDTDTILLPEFLVLLGLRWSWKKEKGLEYAEDFRSYEAEVKDALGRDGAKPVLSMSRERRDATPGICIPIMSWPLP